MTGTIKDVRHDKGFGFVKGADGVERFFHRSQVVPARDFDLMAPGMGVEFDHAEHAKGPRAVNVQRG